MQIFLFRPSRRPSSLLGEALEAFLQSRQVTWNPQRQVPYEALGSMLKWLVDCFRRAAKSTDLIIQ